MFLQIFLLASLASLSVARSLNPKEKINPVNLKYYCIEVETDKENTDVSPVLLIHGLGGSHKNWDGVNQVLALLTKRKVCSVDLRNHGDSPWDNRIDVAALAVDIGHFLDTQGIKKVNLIGHSLGGKTAVHYALNNPDRVDSVIVEDMRPNGVTKEAYYAVLTLVQFLHQSLESIPEGASEDKAKQSIINFLNKKFEEVGLTERLSENSGDIVQVKLIDGKWQFKYNIEVINQAMKDPDYFLTKSTGLYEGPTLFIYGTKSPFKVNEDKDNILKLFPRAKLVPVEGASHSIHGLFRQFDDVVVKFLNELN